MKYYYQPCKLVYSSSGLIVYRTPKELLVLHGSLIKFKLQQVQTKL